MYHTADLIENATFMPMPHGPPHALKCDDVGDQSGQYEFSQKNHKHDHILRLSDDSMRMKQKEVNGLTVDGF